MNTATATVSAAPTTFREVWLICSGHALTHWYVATFYLLLPLIGKELGLSYTEIGLIISVQHIAGAISNVPAGIFVDTVGRKGYLLAAALFWIGLPYALMSVAHNFWMLLACVTLVGIGNNMWHPAAIPTLAHRYPERKGLVLSIHGMGGNLGEALAPLAIGALLAWFSWRTVVVVNVVPGILMAVFILVMLGALTMTHDNNAINATGRKRSSREFLQGFVSLLHNKALMLIASSSAIRSMMQTGLLTFLPVYLAYELGYSPLAVGICLTVLQVSGFIAAPIAGHLSDKLGRKSVVMGSMTLSALTIVGMAFAGKSVVFIIFIALIGFFLYATRAVIQAWAIESTPRHLGGSGVGLLFGLQALGGGISPVVFGMIADHYGIYAGFYFLACTVVVANLLVFLVPSTPAMQDKPVAV
jgi:FSR family fosmidomycin resistance protein-like MFS transporter